MAGKSGTSYLTLTNRSGRWRVMPPWAMWREFRLRQNGLLTGMGKRPYNPNCPEGDLPCTGQLDPDDQ